MAAARLLAALAVLIGLAGQASAQPHSHGGHHGAPQAGEAFTGGDIVVSDVWSPAPPGGARVAAGYLVIENKASQPDRLVGASFPVAGRVEIHQMTQVDNVMRMRPLKTGIEVPARGRVALEPGGYHLMLMDLKEPLKAGDRFAGKLHFDKLGLLPVMITVRARGASPGHDAHGAGHHQSNGHH